jgi:hypothetical protein
MRRLTRVASAALLLGALALTGAACKRKRNREPVKIEEGGGLYSMLQVAEPRGSVQLLKGFYAVEGGAWRWTARQFSVTLRPPRNAAQRGAILTFKFAIPDPVINRLKSMRLSAKVNGLALAPEDYASAGQYVYSRDVPPEALKPDAVVVEFALDKSLPPSPGDDRELGVVASAVGFEAK